MVGDETEVRAAARPRLAGLARYGLAHPILGCEVFQSTDSQVPLSSSLLSMTRSLLYCKFYIFERLRPRTRSYGVQTRLHNSTSAMSPGLY